MTPENNSEALHPAAAFQGLGIAPKLLDALGRLNFTEPTPIQKKAIPVGIEGNDIIGVAQTGTGKTVAFGVPMIQRVARLGGLGLVILPTRELALQVEETLLKIGGGAGLRTAILIGGTSMEPQMRQIRNRPHIVIGTPGRIIDHLERRTLDLQGVTILVLDEADRMLDMGFAPQIRRILQGVPKERQTMLFSATMPDDIVRIAEKYMKMPVRVEVAPQGTPTELVEHELFVVQKDQKNRLLEKLLDEYHGPVLVFSRTKHGARRIARNVSVAGHAAADIHSDRTLAQRRAALDGFKSGKFRVLVATDIAARGIDVSGIELVINFDVPENAEDYVHRIGRTGRAGMKGRAISFATPEQGEEIRAIEKFARIYLNITPMPSLPPDRPRPSYPEDRGGFRGDDRRGGGGFGRRPDRRDSRGGGRGGFSRPSAPTANSRYQGGAPSAPASTPAPRMALPFGVKEPLPKARPATPLDADLGISFFEGVGNKPPSGGGSRPMNRRPNDRRGGFRGRR